MQRYDYVQRIIEQLAAALARIARCKADGRLEAGLEEIRGAIEELGLNPHLVSSLDAGSLGRLLRHPEQLRAVAQLLAEEAELLAAAGREREAVSAAARAPALARLLGDRASPATNDTRGEPDR